ncbi:hypothetical protein PHYPSEUDO_015491 [Phytophthora pseudosyringae]|uniref:Uncharacterized protein n=1 Tax=Phytophthora pseudosyringae TaxID=221518 RepID=A0A8T1W394_9STRA|nr:hypothetical protein PHYPSEUDO_015491 [Phytophthora pseudosyringae]
MKNEADVIIPGHGICRARLEEQGNRFVRDSPEESSSEIDTSADGASGILSLKLNFFDLHSDTTVMNFLGIVGANLKALSIGMIVRRQFHVDLNALATACPNLEEFTLERISLSLFDNHETLRNWGVQKILLRDTGKASDLQSCLVYLNDRAMRMSRELVYVGISLSRTPPPMPSGAVDALNARDGEFLPMAKEKVPAGSKAALISVVTKASGLKRTTSYSKPIHRLNETVMALIFGFAATPEQRTVRIIQL